MPWATSPSPGLQKQPVVGDLAVPGVAEAAGPQGDSRPARQGLERAHVVGPAVRGDQVEGDGPAAARQVGRPEHPGERRPVRVGERRELRHQPAGQRHHPLVNHVDADRGQVLKADRHGRQAEIVDGPVLEPGVAGREMVPPLALHRGDRDGPAGKPGPSQDVQGLVPEHQRPHAGRVAEHLVEGQGDEVRVDHREIEAVARREGRAVEDHVPALLVRPRDPFHRVLHAAEVRLRWVREQVRRVGLAVAKRLGHGSAVDAQLGRQHGQIADAGSVVAGELADAVHRVVVVVRQQEAPAGLERIGLADQLQRPARVGRENDAVLVRVGVEEREDRLARIGDEALGRLRRRIVGMRVAVHAVPQQLVVPPDLIQRVEAPAGVVEVHLAEPVEALVVARPQLVQPGRRRVAGISLEERAVRSVEPVVHLRCQPLHSQHESACAASPASVATGVSSPATNRRITSSIGPLMPSTG